MDGYPTGRGTHEMVGLYERRPAKKREGRLEHSAIANRDQTLQSTLVRVFDQPDDVPLFALPKNELAVGCSKAFVPERFACLSTLRGAKNFRSLHSGISLASCRAFNYRAKRKKLALFETIRTAGASASVRRHQLLL